ncbi:MAG: helix-turn-helix transcriptional regulator [Prevotella sp.]|nr:helix-turn-helix transcriptional regulator [Prevotella sp.]
MEILAQTTTQQILFFILYGVTGAVSLVAAIYLMLRRGNAFAPDVTPPLRLRRWAAAFFTVSALGHVWWFLFYSNLRDAQSMDEVVHKAGYVAIVVFDCVAMLTTIAGTLLSMLQDRRRRIWPVYVAMSPFVALGGVYLLKPSILLGHIAITYILVLYVLFTVYMVFAIRHYRRWLKDNYADLENKRVWLIAAVTLGCLLLFILYAMTDIDSSFLIYLMHLTELVLFSLLLWRVETLPLLAEKKAAEQDVPQTSTPAPQPSSVIANTDLAQIEQLLVEHCVETQLYLQHDLSLQQLAQAIGTNRSYLSQYFSRQGITYNTYINNLRINHFINLYQQTVKAGQPVVAQQLASDSGYRSYSTFSLAFKQRTGQSVTAWMRDDDDE